MSKFNQSEYDAMSPIEQMEMDAKDYGDPGVAMPVDPEQTSFVYVVYDRNIIEEAFRYSLDGNPITRDQAKKILESRNAD